MEFGFRVRHRGEFGGGDEVAGYPLRLGKDCGVCVPGAVVDLGLVRGGEEVYCCKLGGFVEVDSAAGIAV